MKDIEQYNPDADHQQLALTGEAFDVIRTLAENGMITPTSLDLGDPDLPFESYEMIGTYLGRMNRSCAFWVGDWLVFGEGVYGEKFAQAVEATGLAEQTLLNRAYVARNVARSLRKAALPFAVHAEVAALPPKEQRRWLERAENHNWTRADLRAAMKSKRTDTPPPEADDSVVLGPLLEEVARAILRDATEHEDPAFYLVPAEDVARLRAALGEEQA